MKKTLFIIAGLLTALWGIAHLVPTAGVVEDFGEITHDNKLILTMEWLVEGFTLIFLGFLVFLIVLTDYSSLLARRILASIAIMLIALAAISLFTGFRVDFITYKLCPVIFSLSAILLFLGLAIKGKTDQKQ